MTLSVSIHTPPPGGPSADATLADTMRLFNFIHTRKPTREHLEQLQSMLHDPQKAIDRSAVCTENSRVIGGLLDAAAHNEFRALMLDAGFSSEGESHCAPPLYFALRNNQYDYARMLLEHGANPNRIWEAGQVGVYSALNNNGLVELNNIAPYLRLLTDYGFDPNTMLNDKDSSWRLADGSEERLLALLDLGGNLLRYNTAGRLIEQHITHGQPDLKEIVQQRRSEAFACREKLAMRLQPVTEGILAPKDCMALDEITPVQLMLLSNVGSLPMLFAPEVWRGREQDAVGLAHSYLYPYQRAQIDHELTILETRAITPAAGRKDWCSRIATEEVATARQI